MVYGAQDYEKYEYLDISVADSIARITLNRPEKLNACDQRGHTELSTILSEIQHDDSVNAVVVTGAGRAFSVGGDFDVLEAMHGSRPDAIRLFREARAIVQSHIDCDKPIVAAINGVAMGAGLAFGLLCDYIVMERNARIADGHVRAALAAGDGGALIWPLTMGLTKAKKYLLTGDWIDAETAERLGLVTEIVDSGQAGDRALAVARRFATGPQFAVRSTKAALNQWLRLGQLAAFDYSLSLEILSAGEREVGDALNDLRSGGAGAIEGDLP